MKLKSLGVNSKGNCHILTDSSGHMLMLDCGIKYKNILREISDFGMLDLVLYTHLHNDHVQALHDLTKAGIRCYGTDDKLEQKTYKVGNWKFFPIPLYHSVECYGYLIYNLLDDKWIVYMTDTVALPKIKERDYDLMLIECNWTERLVYENAEKDLFSNSNHNDHLSSETLLEWLQSFNAVPKNLILTHTSNSNLDYETVSFQTEPLALNTQFAMQGGTICF